MFTIFCQVKTTLVKLCMLIKIDYFCIGRHNYNHNAQTFYLTKKHNIIF